MHLIDGAVAASKNAAAWALVPFLATSLAAGQSRTGPQVSPRAQSVARIEAQLRWNDERGKEAYVDARSRLTNEILAEVDGFIRESFMPRTASPDVVRRGLDELLNPRRDSFRNNFAATTDLSSGQYLIVGIEIPRGGPAEAEDAISIRAYRNDSGKFVLVTSVSDVTGTVGEIPYLIDLRVLTLPGPPVSGEFWFFSWARISPQSPPTAALRLYAFDGKRFRTVWSPAGDLLTEDYSSLVELVPGGFVVNRAVDPSGEAPHAPSLLVHEMFVPTVDGAIKVREWTSPVR